MTKHFQCANDGPVKAVLREFRTHPSLKLSIRDVEVTSQYECAVGNLIVFQQKSSPCLLFLANPSKHGVAIASRAVWDMKLSDDSNVDTQSFISDRSSNQIPKNHVSFLPFMVVATSLSVEVFGYGSPSSKTSR